MYCNVSISREPKTITIPIPESNMDCRTLLATIKLEAIKKYMLKNNAPICLDIFKAKT